MLGPPQISVPHPATKESWLSILPATVSQYALFKANAVIISQPGGDTPYMVTTPHLQTSRRQQGVDVRYAGMFGTYYPVTSSKLLLAYWKPTKRSSLQKHIFALVLFSTIAICLDLSPLALCRLIVVSMYIMTDPIVRRESAGSLFIPGSVCMGLLRTATVADLAR